VKQLPGKEKSWDFNVTFIIDRFPSYEII